MTTKALSILVACVVMLGCATPPPPRHLLDARAAYQKARSGKAAELAPAELHTAKSALNDAEAAYQDDPESAEANTLAYVALRQAQTVESQANAKAALKDLERAEKELRDFQEAEIQRSHAELSKTKEMLSRRGEQLASTSAQLKDTSAKLAEEKAAREAAMQKLAAAAAINVKEETRGTVIVLPGSVLFASGKYELTSAAQQKLLLVAGTLAPQSETHNIVVEGHTDSRGERGLNMTLSNSRAIAVMNYLVANGVQKDAVTAVGLGPDRPIASNDTREGRAENRRVEIIVTPVEPK